MCPEGKGPDVPMPASYCTRCGGQLSPGSRFCQACGQPVAGPAPPPYYQSYQASGAMTLRRLIMGVAAYASLALLFLMVVNLIIAVWGIGAVYPHMDKHVYLFVITPYIVNFAELGGGLFFLYYIVLVAVILTSFAWMVRRSQRSLAEELEVQYPKKGHSPLYLIGTIFMAVLAFNVIYYLFVQSAGANPTTPAFESRDLWQIIYGFAEASVWEEVISRILLIGVPLLVIDALLESRDPQRKMRKVHNYILGGGFSMGRKEALLLVFSSVMFGTAHVFSWDLFKIFPAAVAGLAFGYLFLRLGVYASILLHFAFDFMSVPLDVAPDNMTVTLLLGLTILVWVAIGIPYVVLYFSKGLGWLMGRRIWPDVPRATPANPYGNYYAPYQYNAPNYAPPGQSPAPVGQAPGPPPAAPSPAYGPPRNPTAFGFTCANCGNQEAVYKDGQLICTRCGRRN